MAERSASTPTDHLLGGLRVAGAVIVLCILTGLVLPNLVASWSVYRDPWVELACWLLLVAVAAAHALLVLRRRSWGAARWPVAGVVLAASVVATAAVPPDDLITATHVTYGVIGWFGVLLFAETSLRDVGLFLTAHLMSTLLQLAAAGQLDRATLVRAGLVLVLVTGFQLAFGVAGLALRRVADEAALVAGRNAEVRTAEVVARHVHADRDVRYEKLRGTAVPLLAGLADGTLRVTDHAVQRRCAVEAARMRRLFAEDDDAGDALTSELAELVDLAERRGVLVQQAVRGRWPCVPPDVVRVVLDEVAGVLLVSGRAARVSVVGRDVGVNVGVVADVDFPGQLEPGEWRDGEVHVVTVIEEGRTWVEVSWTRAAESAP